MPKRGRVVGRKHDNGHASSSLGGRPAGVRSYFCDSWRRMRPGNRFAGQLPGIHRCPWSDQGRKDSITKIEVFAGSRGICLFNGHSIFPDPGWRRCVRPSAVPSALVVAGYQRHHMCFMRRTRRAHGKTSGAPLTANCTCGRYWAVGREHSMPGSNSGISLPNNRSAQFLAEGCRQSSGPRLPPVELWLVACRQL